MAERYRRKSTTIRAVQWDGSPEALTAIALLGAPIDRAVSGEKPLRIKAGPNGQSGWVNVFEGNWVATDGTGDFWPITGEQFAATYETVEASDG